MAHIPTDQPHCELRIFRLAPNGRDLSEIPYPVWQQIISHQRPIEPANGFIKVLILKGQQKQGGDSYGVCKTIDAIRLQTDSFGFALTFLVTSDATANPKLPGPATRRTGPNLIDARQRFLHRYIAHRHSWQPQPGLLAKALALAGYAIH